MDQVQKDLERQRLAEAEAGTVAWKKWGPYLSERQWGTVREDYSPDGSAWNYLPHDHARSRAYRWGEDGLAGFCDDHQYVCLSLALWNGNDPCLKERLFGLTNEQGNHGEDVKELYFYLDATPTSSYLKMLYKYPQAEYPYSRLERESRSRSREEPEFELIETGLFDEQRYFDVFVEYAKAGPEDFLMLVTAWNRGPSPARLHLIPQLTFRNTWTWKGSSRKPTARLAGPGAIDLLRLNSTWHLYFEPQAQPLFCDNETNTERLFGIPLGEVKPKDAFHRFIVNGQPDAVRVDGAGTKVGLWRQFTVEPGQSATTRLRLSLAPVPAPFADFASVLLQRQAEADQFYAKLQDGIADAEIRRIQRQAFAGMLWGKQYYGYDVPLWLKGDPAEPAPPAERLTGRNHDWKHMNCGEVLSMPDKWEYPWFAAWDTAFHCLPLALLDPEFAKEQLILLCREWYMHPNGQLPAYEWNFGDVNPPVHAWAAYRVFQIDRKRRGDCGDLAFLERIFHKLMLNFTWWVNRKDSQGHNLFQGGFLGLDNIGVFDRSQPLPSGVRLDQADATSWMAMYCLNLLRIAIELAFHNPVYEDIATKFLEHFLQIAEAMSNLGDQTRPGGLWDEEEEFYFDQLHLFDGRKVKLKVRSMVGLIPLFAVETLEPENLRKLSGFKRRLDWFLNYRPDLAALVSRWNLPGRGERRLLSVLRGHRIKCVLRRLLDPNEFLSDFGVRSLSRHHLAHPYTLQVGDHRLGVTYEPAESRSALFGGNSNWRGPIWFPVNFLIIESLQKFHHYYGDDFKVECPTGSGCLLNLNEVAEELTRRLVRLFQRDAQGQRPMDRRWRPFQADPYFQDCLQFFEYFDGDTGQGLGAAHQTGWTGVIAKLLMPRVPDPPCPPWLQAAPSASEAVP